jgi:hypothetical protein
VRPFDSDAEALEGDGSVGRLGLTVSSAAAGRAGLGLGPNQLASPDFDELAKGACR